MKDLPTESHMVLGHRLDLRRRLAVAVVGTLVLNLGALLLVDEAKAQDLGDLAGGGSGGGGSSLGASSGGGGGNGGQQSPESGSLSGGGGSGGDLSGGSNGGSLSGGGGSGGGGLSLGGTSESGGNGGQQPLGSVPAASGGGSTYGASSGSVQPVNSALSGGSSSGGTPTGTYGDASGDANSALGGSPAWETAEPAVYGEEITPVEPVNVAVDPVPDAVGRATQETVVPAAATVTETAQPVVTPIQETARPVVEPVQEAARPVVKPVQDVVEPVVAPVRKVVEPVVAPAREAAQPIVAPIEEAAAPVLEPARPTPEPMVTPAVAEPLTQKAEPAAPVVEIVSSGEPAPHSVASFRPQAEEDSSPLSAFSADALYVPGPVASGLDNLEALASLRPVKQTQTEMGAELLVPRSGIDASLLDAAPAVLGSVGTEGGSIPAPHQSPYGSPPSGSLLSGSGIAGGLGLAVLALFSIIPLAVKSSWTSGNFLRPDSALVLAIERPG